MQPEPQREPPRPSPPELAEQILTSLDISPRSESEIITDAYRRFFAQRSAGPNPAPNDPQAIDVEELYRFANAHIGHARGLKINGHVDYLGRIFSEERLANLVNEPISTHCLVELRTRNGSSALLCDERLIPIRAGVATIHLSVVEHNGHPKYVIRPMLSPRAYAAEIENMIELIDGKASPRDLEKHSYLFCDFRGALASNYGSAAPWRRELQSIRFVGPRESPRFVYGFSPAQEFVVTPHFIPESCGVGAHTRLVGQP